MIAKKLFFTIVALGILFLPFSMALKDKTFRFPSINTIMSSKYFE